MIVDSVLAHRFIDAYMAFLATLVSEEERASRSTTQWLALGRTRYAADREALTRYRAANAQRRRMRRLVLDDEMLDAIAYMQIGRFVYLKDTRSYSVCLPIEGEAAYGVLGLTERLRDLTQGQTAVIIEMGLMKLNGRWVSDGLLAGLTLLGPNYKRDYTASYTELREQGAFSLG
nr:hypothetical protein [uncultured Deefgea sp.]